MMCSVAAVSGNTVVHKVRSIENSYKNLSEELFIVMCCVYSRMMRMAYGHDKTETSLNGK